MAAAAQKFGMFLCVQDLTCPGGILDSLCGVGSTCSGSAGHRSERSPVLSGGERPLGAISPGYLSHYERDHDDRWAYRTWVGSLLR